MIHTYSTQKCGRWDFCFFCIIPVKSTDSGFSIDTILPKWGKNGANIKITILNESLSVHFAAVYCHNSSINFTTIAQANIVGNFAYLQLAGKTVIELQANKAYFIPELKIVGYEGKKLNGVGITTTTSNKDDGADSFPCTVSIHDNRVCITPTRTISRDYGVSVTMFCYIY